MTNKYETLYSQIGACVDKLIERGFEFKNITNTVARVKIGRKINIYFYDDSVRIDTVRFAYRYDYNVLNWQKQLLNKVDELLKEDK